MQPSEEEHLEGIAAGLRASDPRLGRALRHHLLPDLALTQVIDPVAALGTVISLVALLAGVVFAMPVLVALGVLVVPFTVMAACMRHPGTDGPDAETPPPPAIGGGDH